MILHLGGPQGRPRANGALRVLYADTISRPTVCTLETPWRFDNAMSLRHLGFRACSASGPDSCFCESVAMRRRGVTSSKATARCDIVTGDDPAMRCYIVTNDGSAMRCYMRLHASYVLRVLSMSHRFYICFSCIMVCCRVVCCSHVCLYKFHTLFEVSNWIS